MKTMDEARIKSLYRRHTEAQHTLDDAVMHEALGRHGFPDVEDTAIDRIAGSAVQSDVMRLVMALGPDAELLSREVAALRRPKPAQQFVRRGLALAAGVGALAILASAIHGGSQPGGLGHALPDTGSIMSGSFEPGMESHQERIELKAAAPIFKGDFDS